ncbi:MAG: hypothetical protein QW035_00930 [Candidatus Anstonellales archaeon]
MKGSKEKNGKEKPITEFEKKKWKNYGFDGFSKYDHWGRKSFTLMSDDELLAQFKEIDELYAYEAREFFSEIKARGLKMPLREVVKLFLKSSLYTAEYIADFIRSNYKKEEFRQLLEEDISAVLLKFSEASSYYKSDEDLKLFALSLCINALDPNNPLIGGNGKKALSKILSDVRISSLADSEVRALIKLLPSIFGKDHKEVFNQLVKNNKELLLHCYIEGLVDLKSLEEQLFVLVIEELPNLEGELDSKEKKEKIKELIKDACRYYGMKEPKL